MFLRLAAVFVASMLAIAACSGSELAPIPSTNTRAPATTAARVDAIPTTLPPVGDTTTTAPLAPLLGVELELIETDLSFPVLVFASGAQSYVADKAGRIVLLTGQTVLDISDKVLDDGERGLLGAAFHPLYDDGSLLVVHYTNLDGNTQVSSFSVTDNVADASSEKSILEIAQPAGNHNGGMVQFDVSGLLYVGLGDGGGSNDRYGNGQNLSSLLGSILRIDVTDAAGYTVPPDNPFVGQAGALPEIWAWGLRNPWRFWIDAHEGRMIIADVGQNQFEEVDVVPMQPGGMNLGWPITEALHCFSPSAACDTTGLTLPVVEVSHADAASCSITGGIVYRGSAIPELSGTYFFSDFCGGYLRAFDPAEPSTIRDYTEELGGPIGQVSSFGEGADGEMYITTSRAVFKLVPRR